MKRYVLLASVMLGISSLFLISIQFVFALDDSGLLAIDGPSVPEALPIVKTIPEQDQSTSQLELQAVNTVSALAAPASVPATATFTIGQNFTGSSIDNSGFRPPDTMGAVGLSHIVELINGRYAVFNKNGVFLQGSALDAFWNNAGVAFSGTYTFDPRVVYDKFSARWFAVAVDNPGGASGGNNFLVAVSNSSDPTTGWTGFAVDSDSGNTHWADFPMLGINQDVVVVAANMFAISDGSLPVVTTLVVPKSDLTAVTPTVGNATIFEKTDPNTTGYGLQPAFDQDDGNLPLVLLSAFNKPGGILKSSTIGGTAIAPTLNTAGGVISVTPRNAPPDIDQPGTKTDIDAGDNRFSGNVIVQHIPGRPNPSLWGAEGVYINARAAIEWYEIDTVTNSLLQSGTISDTSLAFNYPSIAVNDYGDVVIGFSGGDPSTYISTYVAVGHTRGGTTTLSAPQITKAGAADYMLLDGSARNRWGDYSATVVDPSDEQRFWTVQEFVSATDKWAIQYTEIIIKGVKDVFPWSSFLPAIINGAPTK